MKPVQAVCNYALLQFLPYAETGEFVNVGVLVACQQPCLLHFEAETEMPARVKAMFPRQNELAFAAAMGAFGKEMLRVQNAVRDPKSCQMLFGEMVRRRESLFRFGEVRTILTDDPSHLAGELLRRFIRVENPRSHETSVLAA
jgi:hypothetical protein